MILLPMAGGLFSLVDNEDEDLLSSKWHPVKGLHTCYARRSPAHDVHETLHSVIGRRIGITEIVDHKNRCGLDCRRSNLRAATKSQNAANEVVLRSSNTTGYRGVSPYKDYWQVKCRINGRKVHVGYFRDKIEAAMAYDDAAKRAFGEFATLNFP